MTTLELLIVVALFYGCVTLAQILERIDDQDPNKSHAEWINGKWNGRQ